MNGGGREFLDLLEKVAEVEDLPNILAACSGRRIYIPHRYVSADSWIVAAIGQEKADALVKQLNEAGWYGSEVEVPFDGGGMWRAHHRANTVRIADGVRAGKSNSVIAAEIGITRRAVVMSKARMRKRGELPEVDPDAALRTRYLGTAFGKVAAHPATVARFGGEPPKGLDDADTATVGRPAAKDLSTCLPDEANKRDRIIALIRRECEEAETSRILELAASQPLSIRPSAARSPKHPFNIVLGQGRGSLLALKIVSAFPGTEVIKFKDVVSKLTPMAAKIREKLLYGVVPERIAADLNVPVRRVHSQAQALRRAGLLPPARPRRKLRGY